MIGDDTIRTGRQAQRNSPLTTRFSLSWDGQIRISQRIQFGNFKVQFGRQFFPQRSRGITIP